MGFFRFFQTRNQDTARIAKDRLQVLIAHERNAARGPDYLPQLKQDILDVIKKYVAVGEDSVSVQLDSQDDCDVLELNITLPEHGDGGGGKSSTSTPAKRDPVSEAEERRAALKRQVRA